LTLSSQSHTSPSDTNRILNWYSTTGGTEIDNSAISLVVGNNSSATDQPRAIGLALFNRNTTNANYSPAITFGGLSKNGNYMNGAAAIAARLTQSGSDPNFVSGDLTFYTQSTLGLTEKVRISASGNVGIGTTSPGAKLHNYSTATSNVFISGYGTAAQNDWGGEHAFFVNANNGIIIGKANAQNDTNRLYTFYNDAAGNAEQYIYNTSNTATIKLDSAGDTYFNGGNVGIGTTAPIFKLHIKGSSNYDGAIAVDNSTTTGGGSLVIRQNGVNSGFISVVGSALGTSDRNLAYYAEVGLGHRFFVNDGTTALTITSSGNVGIGTTTPTTDSILHVRRASSGVTARTDLGGTIIAEGNTRAGLYILTAGTAAGSSRRTARTGARCSTSSSTAQPATARPTTTPTISSRIPFTFVISMPRFCIS
jgi:hypothetical protein